MASIAPMFLGSQYLHFFDYWWVGSIASAFFIEDILIAISQTTSIAFIFDHVLFQFMILSASKFFRHTDVLGT
jgi:hypothetical protein